MLILDATFDEFATDLIHYNLTIVEINSDEDTLNICVVALL